MMMGQRTFGEAYDGRANGPSDSGLGGSDLTSLNAFSPTGP